MVDSNFAFIDHVSAVYYGGQAGNAHSGHVVKMAE